MSSLEAVLRQEPWVPYHDTFFHSRLVLTYPKNQIFTTQLVNHMASLPVYHAYPSAHVFDVARLQGVDWEHETIALDHDLRVVKAPEPVLELIRLDRRLRYTEAADTIFGPFRWLPVTWFQSQWVWILLLVTSWLAATFWSSVGRHTPRRLAVPSTTKVG